MLITSGVNREYPVTSGGLAIKAGGSAVAATAADVYYYTANNLRKLAAGDMAALAGTVVTTKFNVFVFAIDKYAGTKYTKMGVEGSSLASVVFPSFGQNQIVLGYVIINPTGTGDFAGGTTPLDDATVAPNAVYVNCAVGLYI